MAAGVVSPHACSNIFLNRCLILDLSLKQFYFLKILKKRKSKTSFNVFLNFKFQVSVFLNVP